MVYKCKYNAFSLKTFFFNFSHKLIKKVGYTNIISRGEISKYTSFSVKKINTCYVE